jgi:DNA helicase-2/ATP-dependent DNA helicase PcrA
MNYNQVFQKAYEGLNPSQKEAVNAIDGPVMVIAGPGTGKTQVIAARIGNILRSTDTAPDNILCLTYTDAATVAMRKRLVSFIGPTAYNINIHTFHAFCNMVIQDNLIYFGGYRDLQPLSELERAELLEEMVDGLAKDHPLKRLTGDRYYEIGRLQGLFDIMKKENWSSEFVIGRIDQYLKEVPFMDEFIYKTSSSKHGYKKGDLKEKEIKKVEDKMEKLRAATELFDVYNNKLRENKRYDFHDMIRWVLDAFEAHPDLLSHYQERFQYILVDEYQDTNGSQNDLLYRLCDFWEAPNVFVVGDDDQSIFRFQGASTENIKAFRERYRKDLKEVVLTENYRSTQAILDAARVMIKEGEDRLEDDLEHLTKELVAKLRKDSYGDKPGVTAYYNSEHLEADLVQRLDKAHKAGEKMNRYAVIYRNHKQVEGIVKALEKKGIPLYLKRKINILEDFEIHRIIELCTYIAEEAETPYKGDHRLAEIMHYSFFHIHPMDIARISRHCAYRSEEKKSKRWKDVLQQDEELRTLGLQTFNEVRAFRNNLNKWIGDYHNVSVQVLLENILSYGGILSEMLTAKDKAWNMQLLSTFFNQVKEESRRKPFLKMKDFIAMLDRMDRYKIQLPIQRTFLQEDGVHFLTAHSSKGLEFDHVIILGANHNIWEGKRKSNFTYTMPPTLVQSDDKGKLEDERRLFYVAMTRAETKLDIYYSMRDQKSKDLQESRFVVEMKGENVLKLHQREDDKTGRALSDDEMIEYGLSQILQGHQVHYSWIDHAATDKVLETFRLSVTALNKYLQCPTAFYFENILRVPQARTVHAGFGNAIHYTLERLHNHYKSEGGYPPMQDILEIFEKSMYTLHSHFTELEFEDRMAFGKKILPHYVEEYRDEWLRVPQFEMEYPIPQAVVGEVPIKGRLDRVEMFEDGLRVIDFKTGKSTNGKKKIKGPSEKEPLGGDYWRQMVFYKFLVDGDPRQKWVWKDGMFDFVQPKDNDDQFERISVPVSDEDEEVVRGQIEEVWARIGRHEFENGCGEEDCNWCKFLRYNRVELGVSGEDEEAPGMDLPTAVDPI